MSNRIKPRKVEPGEGEATAAAAGEPMSKGTYATYRTPKGGIHLVYRPADAGEDQHMEIPPIMVAMAERAASGQAIDMGTVAKIMRGARG